MSRLPYPHNLTSNQLKYILKVGDIITYKNRKYCITQVIRTYVPGQEISFVIKEWSDND